MPSQMKLRKSLPDVTCAAGERETAFVLCTLHPTVQWLYKIQGAFFHLLLHFKFINMFCLLHPRLEGINEAMED